MENFILYSGVFLLAIMLMPMYRAVVGPTTLDRLMGMNAIGSKTVALIVIIGLVFERGGHVRGHSARLCDAELHRRSRGIQIPA